MLAACCLLVVVMDAGMGLMWVELVVMFFY